jgi:hypothetical protein
MKLVQKLALMSANSCLAVNRPYYGRFDTLLYEPIRWPCESGGTVPSALTSTAGQGLS